jgi:hypothetical protein
MSDIQNIIESIGFSTKDKREIDKARKQAESINSVIDKTRAEGNHAYHGHEWNWLHHEADRLEQVLVNEPTHMNAEVFHAALIRYQEGKITGERIGAALGVAWQRVSQSLADIVNGLLDATRKKIIAEADKRRADLATSNHALFSNEEEKRTLEARVQSLILELNAERTEALRDPLSWLERAGLALDEPAQAGDEAAA